MDDDPAECPSCGCIALLPIRAAEAVGPLLFACAECMVTFLPEEYAAAVMVPMTEPEKKSLLDRLMEALR